MSGMVEQVARALSEAGCAADWSHAMEGARAAIMAMRNQTQDMTDSHDYQNGEWSRRNIKAYFDAALSPSGGWRLIDDGAPRDGTPVDLWLDDGTRAPDCYWSGGWTDPNGGYDGAPEPLRETPTHWKPIRGPAT